MVKITIFLIKKNPLIFIHNKWNIIQNKDCNQEYLQVKLVNMKQRIKIKITLQARAWATALPLIAFYMRKIGVTSLIPSPKVCLQAHDCRVQNIFLYVDSELMCVNIIL